jgi:peptide deformylase
MPERPFALYPDKALVTPAEPVIDGDVEAYAIIADLFDTLKSNSTVIGLGANQIGILKAIAIVDLERTGDPEKGLVLINPVIEWTSEETNLKQEANPCLPGIAEHVERPNAIRVRYMDKDFTEQTLEAEDMLARCIQHEVDHLHGKVFIDRISKLRRDRALKKLRKLGRETA